MRRVVPAIIVLLLTGTLLAKPVRPITPPPKSPGSGSRVIMETNLGNVVIDLYPDKAPLSVKNFLQYVDDRHYDGTIFHRVIPNFMIQAGGFEPGLREKKTREPIKNESMLPNARGTIAMARTSTPDSATAQFFINTVDNKFLDQANNKAGHCVFGKVVEGMDVVDRISAVKTQNQGVHYDVPVQDVVIRTIRRAN